MTWAILQKHTKVRIENWTDAPNFIIENLPNAIPKVSEGDVFVLAYRFMSHNQRTRFDLIIFSLILYFILLNILFKSDHKHDSHT